MRFEWPFFACHNSEVVCTQTKLWRWKQKLLVLIMTVTICYKHQVFVLVITIIFIIIDVSKVLPMLHSLFTTYRNDRVSMGWFLLRLTVKRLMYFCCDQKKICRFTANGLPHFYSQTRVGEQGGRARALREVWFLFFNHNTRGLLLTPPASSKQVDLAASVADQLRACSQAQLKPSAEPDERLL